MRIALTRPVSRALSHCTLTHLDRVPIDVAVARQQHARYEQVLEALGCAIHRLPTVDDLPDAVFVEDTAVVLNEAAIITRPGAASRRAETAAVAEALSAFRPIHTLTPPAMLDGGDVLRVGRTLYVGRSSRTNDEGLQQLQDIVAPYHYIVRPASVEGCLHFKSAATVVTQDTVLINPEWMDPAEIDDVYMIPVPPEEPFASNVLMVGSTVVMPAGFPMTQERLETYGVDVVTVDVSELAKAEGGVTCCSLIFTA